MSMRDQHIAKPGVMFFERPSKFLEMATLTNARIDQNGGRVLLDQEIGVIAVTGHWARVVRVESDWVEHGFVWWWAGSLRPVVRRAEAPPLQVPIRNPGITWKA